MRPGFTRIAAPTRSVRRPNPKHAWIEIRPSRRTPSSLWARIPAVLFFKFFHSPLLPGCSRSGPDAVNDPLNRGSNDDDGGGGNRLDARDTSSMMAHSSSYSTVDKRYHSRVRTGNSCICNRESNSRLRPKRRRQNAARERKPIHLPPMQLEEAFSFIFPFSLLFFEGREPSAKDFLDA